ncbi:phosphatidylserine decarboxylase [Sphingomonas sp. AP4-R1]|uniref:archaetidylserine decarboxylase n=1 Tax=Sphingomonas sp. AP4-R1 TaxID=2735134 RepID=UPI0014933754|nr:archaetidylserine decarboxylase [Sphingomonas sp. AP4-R1]QJU60018.1 phosphatidylserine decarboxylase [Sphingomonas sp. AP4-R1]
MTVRGALMRVLLQEDVNFLLTNRLPRRFATNAVGWFSKIEQPLVAKASIRAWRIFSDLDLSDAAATRFRSMHDCFTRALKPGARPVDPRADVVASPCDAIVGANGTIASDEIHQIKGMPYSLAELLGDAADAKPFLGGTYVTLRLTAAMYHHFHAPDDLTVERVRYLSGDCWNVNPIALKRVERLFCRNERAVVSCRLREGGAPVLLVAVAAILVAGIRLTFLNTDRLLREGGDRTVPLAADMAKGEEMGWFEHGSTIVMFLPEGFALAEGVGEGRPIRQGEAIARRV